MIDPLHAQMPERQFYGWKNAGLLFFVYMATTGLVFYALSVIFPVMLEATGWNRGDASIAITVATLAAGFLVPFAVKILNKVGARRVIIIGLMVTFVNLFLLSTIVTKLWHWIVVWGIMIPAGRVLCHRIAVQTTIMYWFNRKRAMAIGFVMTGAPIGGFFAPPIYTWFMTHMGGWRFGWMLSTGVVLFALILSFFIKNKPSELGQFPDGIAPDSELSKENGPSPVKQGTFRTQTGWTLKEALKSRAIWFITGANIAQAMSLGLVVNHGVLHLTDIGYSNMDAAYILSMIIISSGIVRFPMGYIGDRIEPRWIILTAMVFMLVGFIGIWKAPGMGTLMIFGPIYGIAYGSLITIFPTIIGNYYGPDVFANINAFFAPFLTIVGSIVPTAAGYTVESFGSYNGMFLVLTLLLVVGLILSAFLGPPQKKIEIV